MYHSNIYLFRYSLEEWMKANLDHKMKYNKNYVSLKFLNKTVNRKNNVISKVSFII